MWDEALWGQLAQSGLLGTAIPDDFGGSGEGFVELCALLEQAGAFLAPLPLWPCLVLGALPIATWGTESQKRAYLQRVADGDAILTAAIHEPANPDPYAPATTATPRRSQLAIDRRKDCGASSASSRARARRSEDERD